MTSRGIDLLLEAFGCGSLQLKNRVVMAPMTRCFSPGGVPGPDVAAYYRRRAEHDVGLLRPLVDAGVDIFDCSQRRYWEAEFEGSPLNLAGWTKKLSGRPTITVGSVSLSNDTLSMLEGQGSEREGIERLLFMMQRGDFDLVAVGRGLIVDPDWIACIRTGGVAALTRFSASILSSLH